MSRRLSVIKVDVQPFVFTTAGKISSAIGAPLITWGLLEVLLQEIRVRSMTKPVIEGSIVDLSWW